ncbi:unnamed protein product [Meloidogyne enterolobii]|uniref:Uncharacterized protein n=1 Tax=Meloidogyne enterolobii TaxID=390850 RepID=A0ACB0XKJ2_MELEN
MGLVQFKCPYNLYTSKQISVRPIYGFVWAHKNSRLRINFSLDVYKEGLERLLSVYSNGGSSNNGGSWGDPQIVEKQIEHNKCEIDALSEQIRRFKVNLD